MKKHDHDGDGDGDGDKNESWQRKRIDSISIKRDALFS